MRVADETLALLAKLNPPTLSNALQDPGMGGAIGQTITCAGVRVAAGDSIVADDAQAMRALEKGLTVRQALAKFAKI